MSKFNNGKNLALVVQLGKVDKEKTLALLKTNASSIFSVMGANGRYAFILHDKDTDDNGELKNPHLHIFFSSPVGMSSDNWVSHFSDMLKVEPDAVSVDVVRNERACLRYLVHADDAKKHQYEHSEIVSNLGSALKTALNASHGFVSNPSLEELLEASEGGKEGIYRLVGMSSYAKAVKVLEDLEAENRRIAYIYSRVENLRDFVADTLIDAKYRDSEMVPFSVIRDIVKACDETMSEIITIKELNR